jgi:hypothetical protein
MVKRAALFATVLLAATPFRAAHAQVLSYSCTSRDVTGDRSPADFEVNLATSKVSFPKGDPPRTVTVEITDNEFAFVVPYNYYEVKIDRRSGLVLTRSNRRIWAENGTCTPAKAN